MLLKMGAAVSSSARSEMVPEDRFMLELKSASEVTGWWQARRIAVYCGRATSKTHGTEYASTEVTEHS